MIGWYLLFGVFKQALAEVATAKAAGAAAMPAAQS